MSRVTQRQSIRSFRQSSDFKAAALCIFDFGLFAIVLATVVMVPNIFVKVIASLALGLVIARLFVLGHDACHQSLFTQRVINRWLGRLLFAPSLTPYSLWEVGHNLGHHVYTNLRGMDYVWTPLSKAEFDGMSPWRQRAERFYRSGYGCGAYYLIELWWRKLFFASSKEIPTQRREFIADSLLALGFGVAWIGALIGAAIVTGQNATVVVLTGFVVPFLLWNWIMGTVIYLHHTHPLLPWYNDIDQWEAARDTGCTTVHVLFPARLGRILNNIMEHPAHHLDVRIPLYNLEAANRALSEPAQVSQLFSLALLRDCVTHCKLYDYDSHRWTDFAGHSSGPVLAPAVAGA